MNAAGSQKALNGGRFTLLDVLRGLASLSVVVWHWQHFLPSSAHRSDQPFYLALLPLYSHGHLAVDLFFVLSGFIFFSLYAERVATGKVCSREFFWLRFSRLYPLHFATLLGVAALQGLHHHLMGRFFVYPTNDLKHFALHLFFASNWHPSSPASFNGPVWSVSIEVLLYIAFFAVCRFRLTSWRWLTAVAICGAALSLRDQSIGRGVFGFFTGGICWYVVRWADLTKKVASAQGVSFALIAAAIFCSYSGLGYWMTTHIVDVALRILPQLVSRRDLLAELLETWQIRVVAFPPLVVLLGLSEERLRTWFRHITWIGNITYSTYLLHFPLQILTVLACYQFGLQINYRSPLLFVTYMTTLVLLAFLTYDYFERPVQQWIRRQTDGGRVRASKH